MLQQRTHRRRRPALSCLACRNRKIKCDRASTCANCVSTGVPCIYSSQALSEGRPEDRQYSDSPTTRPAESGYTLSDVVITKEAGHTPTARQEQLRTKSPLPTTTQLLRNVRGTVFENQRRAGTPGLDPRNSIDFKLGWDLTGRAIVEHHLRLGDGQVLLNKTRLLKWSHWIGIDPRVRKYRFETMSLN